MDLVQGVMMQARVCLEKGITASLVLLGADQTEWYKLRKESLHILLHIGDHFIPPGLLVGVNDAFLFQVVTGYTRRGHLP